MTCRFKREKEVVEKDLSLIKQELAEVKKEKQEGPRSPARYGNTYRPKLGIILSSSKQKLLV